jgi:cobalt-zinc-cadmium efflux system outer membrane protein
MSILRSASILVLSGFVLSAAFAGAPSDPPDVRAIADNEASMESGSVSLDSLLQQMLANNPEIASARKRWEAMQKRPGQEGALPDPTIRMGWTGVGNPLPGAGLGSAPMASLGIGVAQMLPFPGKRGLRSGIAQREADSEAFLFEATKLNLVNRLKSAFYDLQFVYDANDVLKRDRSLLSRLAKTAEIRYAAGAAMQQDLIKSQVEISIIETRILELERRKQSRVAEINSLLNRDVGSPLGRPQPPGDIPELPSLESLQRSALQSSPILRAQRETIGSRQLATDLARRNYYPDFEVMGAYGNQGSMKDSWQFQIQMNIPIYFARKQRLGLEEAGVRVTEAQKIYRSDEELLGFKIKDAFLAAETSHRLMELYSKLIIPQASLALESSLLSYGTGDVDFLSVLSNFTTILEQEMNYYQSRSQYLQALANLEELSGQKVSG